MLTPIMQETLTNAGLQWICVYTVSSTGELALYSTSTVALSATEAEYMAMTEVMKKAIWFQGLLDDLGIE